MRYSNLTNCIAGEGAAAWGVHTLAAAARGRGEDVIVMSSGDPDFDTPPAIVDAAVAALRAGATHYEPIQGRLRLRRAIARRHSALSGQAVSADNVIVTVGCQNALFSSALVLLEPGDEVLVLEPMYVTYEACLGAAGANLVPVPCPPARGFRLDPDALRAAVTNRTRAIFYATPVNPTGVALAREDLEVIAEVARAHDLWVVADEVYGTLVFEGEHHSIAALPGMAERTVTLDSMSKSHAMTGWRTGWAIGPEPFIEHMDRLALCMTYGLSGFVQEAAAEGLERDLDELRLMAETYRRRRDLAFGLLDGVSGLSCYLPQGGMFMMTDVRATGLTTNRFVAELYEQEGVSVLDGGAFGPSTQGTVRICFAISDAEIEEGCRRIVRFVRGLRERECA